MGSAERRERESAETRQKILDAARDLFVENGYAATSMRAIAKRIEYTPTAIYHHFASKEALLDQLCAMDFRSLATAFQAALRVDDPIEKLERIGAAYVDFALSHPMHYQFMFMTVRPGPGEGHDIVHGDPTEDAYALLVGVVGEAIRSGRLLPEYDDADRVAQMLWGALHGLLSLRIAKQHDPWVDFRDVRRTAELAQGTLIRGMLRS